MRAFTVTVRTASAIHVYQAISTSSVDALCAAVDRFGPCAVSVRAAR